MSLNASYLVIFKNPRDKSEIMFLGQQFCPKSNYLQESYRDATARPHGYLVLDFKQDTPENLRVRTSVLPDEYPPIVYQRKL